MKNDAGSFQKTAKLLKIPHVPFNNFHRLQPGQILPPAGRKIVQNNDRMPLFEQGINDMGTDKTCPPCYYRADRVSSSIIVLFARENSSKAFHAGKYMIPVPQCKPSLEKVFGLRVESKIKNPPTLKPLVKKIFPAIFPA